MGGGEVGWKSLCLGGGLVQYPQHIVQSKGSCRAARIIPFFKFRGILINSRENVTQEIKKETNKQEVFSKVFFLFLALFCQNSFSCATCLWNNISGNEARQSGLYVFDSFSPDCI